jgi:hypothetical protein
MLRRIAGPGVPHVLAYVDEPIPHLVTTVSPPLRLERLPLPQITIVLATVAEIVSRAHQAGVVHGPFRLEDVQAGPDGVLVSGWHRATPGEPGDDVAELGRLLEGLASGDPTLVATARRALTPGALTAAGLADALRAHPTAPRPARRPRRARAVAGIGVGVGALALGTLGLVVAADGPPPAPPTTPPATTELGNVVERDGRTWRIGQPDDVVVAGRFACGYEAPALLRPSTGQIWTFTSWQAGRGTLVETRPGATSLGVRRDGRCDRLEVRDAQGRWRAVG